ncbi:hypothetical protein [Aeromicrobium sp. Leaf291]|uniref:hypothetical protein n=1 Tax=Aeromicrobium sp. Leaf291 TaxID=1736325 RepID=UPI0006FA4B98|nr:hypothetical protein [Aeromicrobium sp. Leaf291]KQP84931.1 hypothetical protein ASF35_08845 [Aeromicrobium sp. Leaf291]
MTWWNQMSSRARLGAVVGAVLVLALGTGTAFALTSGGSDEKDTTATPTTSTTPTASASPTDDVKASDDPSGADQTSTGGASTGTIVVTVATSTGERPIESGVAATNVDTGQRYDSGMGNDRPSWTLKGVAPGRYVVSAGSDDDDWESAWYGQTNPVEGDRSQAKVVTVEPGETVRVTVTLIFWPCAEPPGTYPECGTNLDPEPTPTTSASTPAAEPEPSSAP